MPASVPLRRDAARAPSHLPSYFSEFLQLATIKH